jgi:hypothetical protein
MVSSLFHCSLVGAETGHTLLVETQKCPASIFIEMMFEDMSSMHRLSIAIRVRVHATSNDSVDSWYSWCQARLVAVAKTDVCP